MPGWSLDQAGQEIIEFSYNICDVRMSVARGAQDA